VPQPRVKPVHPIIRRVKGQRLTYLPFDALNDLFDAAVAADQQRRTGIFLEAGCALGGSAIVLARAKDRARPLLVYDVFGMIPAPSEADDQDVHERYETISSGQATGLGGDTYYGYEPGLKAKVRENFERFRLPLEENAIRLVEGLFENTIVGDEPVALAHIDGDWYESVRTCVERIAPRLVPGGVMVIDDYFMWSGCRRAIDEFLARHPGGFRTTRRARLHIERV
jgi:O-methyltransferase